MQRKERKERMYSRYVTLPSFTFSFFFKNNKKTKQNTKYLNFGLQNERTRTLSQNKIPDPESKTETLDEDRESFAEVIDDLAVMSDFY